MFWFTKIALLYLWRSCRWHSDTTPYNTTPMGAVTSIAPILPKVAKRVLITLLSLWKPLWLILSEHYGWRRPGKIFLKTVFGKDVFRKNLGMGLPCSGGLQRKVFEKGFCWKQRKEENCFQKLW